MAVFNTNCSSPEANSFWRTTDRLGIRIAVSWNTAQWWGVCLVCVSSWVLAPEAPLPLMLVPEESWMWSRQSSQILASEFPRRLARTWAIISLHPRFWFCGSGKAQELDQRWHYNFLLNLFNFTDKKAEFPGFISHCAKHFLKMEHLINIKSGGFLLLVAHD